MKGPACGDEKGLKQVTRRAMSAPYCRHNPDAWGRQFSATGSTVNPYRYGGAWGYITDPSGMLQLGARFYWPEVGRFISQYPIGEGMNWYVYVWDNPATAVDPAGRVPAGTTASARRVVKAAAAGGAAVAGGVLMCSEAGELLYELGTEYPQAFAETINEKRCLTQYEHQSAAEGGKPARRGPWELDDHPDIQCWVGRVEKGKKDKCGKRPIRYLKICWRKRQGRAWGDWRCNDDNERK